ESEAAKARRLVALQRHAGRALQTELAELLARSDVSVAGIADDDARRLVALGCNAREARFFERRPRPFAELLLRLPSSLEAQLPSLAQHGAEPQQRVGRQRGVVEMTARLVGFHNLQPLAQITGEAGALRVLDTLARALAEHDERAARRRTPAFLR